MSQAAGATPRIREVGDSALLIELEEAIDPDVNARAVAIGEAIRLAGVDGLRDVVTTYRSVGVFFDPLRAELAAVKLAAARATGATGSLTAGQLHEVEVVYGGEAGPDLEDVGKWAGLAARDVARRHAEHTYRVYMLGFLPGFAYMGRVDPAIAAPRRSAPRLRVPAGSVGIAGAQTGVYPLQSPGGWQLIGRTDAPLFDPGRERPSLFAPGDSVRFVPSSSPHVAPHPLAPSRTLSHPIAPSITVLAPGLFTTVQDLGRWGHQARGVSVAGAMDSVAHVAANLAVGNDPSAAALEATLTGPELRFETAATVAVAGADLGATLGGTELTLGVPVRCNAGSVLRFGGRKAGARAYIAIAGGIDSPVVLGSRATHGLSGLGGRPLRAGDQLRTREASERRRSIGRAGSDRLRTGSRPGEGARLRVLPGPQAGFFGADAFDALHSARYTISPHSNRMGYRLAGVPISAPGREMISDVTFPGAIQVPPSGEPILLMADRQTIGGYPQIAAVIAADLPAAGQLAPGDWIEFTPCDRHEALAALREQQAALR